MTSPTGRMQLAAAFTLLEVLVAVVLTGMVVALLTGVFHAGLMAYRKGEERGRLLAAGRGACGLLAADLHRQLAILAPECSFGSGELRFLAAPEQSGAPLVVTWELGGNGIARRTTSWQKTPAAGRAVPDGTVATGLQRGRFEYCVDGQWKPSLPSDATALPSAVRVQFTLATRTEDVAFTGTWPIVRGPTPDAQKKDSR